ncbi:MAG: class I SAM-dependent methyltransferase [Alphaproteobacteria bacterium]|nr:class I SAM-dependent methyltransferase [Alphaproteobacteria bacterium]
MTYNNGNLKKHTTANPLKKLMLRHFNRKLLDIINSLNLQQQTIFDAGCGEGFISNLLALHVSGAKIHAMDASPQAIAYAQKHQSDKICFSTGDIYNIDAEDGSFELVCSTEVLEHLKLPEAALKELVRIARRYVLVSVPKEPYFCLGNLLSGKNIRRFGNPPDHINHYTFRGFEKFIKRIFPDKKVTVFDCIVWTIALIEK